MKPPSPLPLTTAPLPERERADARRNRERILCAAARLVDEHGIDHVSMDDVAAAAGVAATAFALGVHEPRPRLTAADQAQVEQILDASLPDVSELVTGQTGSEQLLDAAIGS